MQESAWGLDCQTLVENNDPAQTVKLDTIFDDEVLWCASCHSGLWAAAGPVQQSQDGQGHAACWQLMLPEGSLAAGTAVLLATCPAGIPKQTMFETACLSCPMQSSVNRLMPQADILQGGCEPEWWP